MSALKRFSEWWSDTDDSIRENHGGAGWVLWFLANVASFMLLLSGSIMGASHLACGPSRAEPTCHQLCAVRGAFEVRDEKHHGACICLMPPEVRR